MKQKTIDEVLAEQTPIWMAIPGVVGTGITKTEDGKLAIMIFTENSQISNIPQAIEGIPVVVEPSGRFEAFALTRQYRPVPIGVSVGNNNECAAGTIGCQVWKNGILLLMGLSILEEMNLKLNGGSRKS